MKTTRQDRQIEWFRVTRMLDKLKTQWESHHISTKLIGEILCYLEDRKKELQ